MEGYVVAEGRETNVYLSALLLALIHPKCLEEKFSELRLETV
jgi:hypothetical protein